MKLFSRKAIAAVAATVALTTAGVSAPAFAEPTPVASSELLTGSSNADSNAPGAASDGSSSENKEPGEGSSLDTSNPESISGWIGVFTAIISALSAAFVFFQRITG